jgi:hypothetical protein
MIICYLALILNTDALDLNKENKMEGNNKASHKSVITDNPFGILAFLYWNHPWNNYLYPDEETLERAVKLLKEANVGIVRMDFLWQDIEPRQGNWDFAKYDYIVDLLDKNNIKILGVLNYYTDWASPIQQWNYPLLEDSSMFVNYCLKVVSRYKDRVKYWEVWNEPDSYTYWAIQDGLKSYCLLLKDVYTALKKIAPDSQILNGGLANGLASVNRLYDNGAQDYFDILNVHIFETPLDEIAIKRVTAYVKAVHKVMSRRGDGHKKIWVTEIGCPGVKNGLEVKNWWQGKNPSEEKQASWVKEVFTQLTAQPTVEKVFWAFFQDTKKHWDNGVDYFGLVRCDFSKKSSFAAYQRCYKNWVKIK